MTNDSIPLKPIYPDVLGQITGGQRINMDALEVALGVYPQMAFINQPAELVIVMQNMVNQPLKVKMGIRVPNSDPNGNVIIVELSKSSVSMTIGPAEVGVLRLPMIVRAPTKPIKNLPISVAIRFRIGGEPEYVRPPGGGAPASVLSVSPFKLQALREIKFIAHKWNESTDILTANLSIANKTLPNDPGQLRPNYEVLWSQEGLRKEIRLAQARFDEAKEIASPGHTGDLYPAFTEVVKERFANRGMPLHPGEAMAIAKMMTYTVEDAPAREPGIVLEDMYWFRALCQVLAANPEVYDQTRAMIISHYVFDEVLYEAVLVAFRVLEGKVDEDLGDEVEQFNYANRFMNWFSGHGEADLTYVYLPLLIGGLSIARLVRSHIGENPWYLADAMDEAFAGRLDLMSGQNVVVFDILDKVLEEYKAMLRARRIARPENLRSTSQRDNTKSAQPNNQNDSGKNAGGIRRLGDG